MEANVRVDDESVSADELADLMHQLRLVLEKEAAFRVDFVPTDAPLDVLAAGAVETARLVVELAADAGLVKLLVESVADWTKRRRVHGVQVDVGEARLYLPDTSAAESRESVEQFVAAALQAQSRLEPPK